MKLNIRSIDDFRNGFERGTISNDEIHIVYPESMMSPIPEWNPSVTGHDLFLQQEDVSNPDYGSAIQRIKNTLMSKMIRAHCLNEFAATGLPLEHAHLFENLVLDRFKGDAKDFLEFISLSRFNFSSVDKTRPTSLEPIIQAYSRFFDERFFGELTKMSLPTTPTIGQLEVYLCLLTNYRKAPSTMPCDLLNDNNGRVEVKCRNGRLGGQNVDNDGISSKIEFARLLGCQEDPLRKWGVASYKYYQEILSDILHIDRRHARSLIESLMNYKIKVDRSMIESFLTDCEKDLRGFHGALQLHCYSVTHGFSELIFLHKNGESVVSYQGKTFLEAREFFARHLRNRGGWGSQNQDRSGLQVEFYR